MRILRTPSKWIDFLRTVYAELRACPRMKYEIHLAAVAVLILFTAHVEIITRAVCATCPAVYWFFLGGTVVDGDDQFLREGSPGVVEW